MSPAPTISIRPTDSDDVKWALQTATTQADRGSLAEAIQWVKRAAQHAEESGDAWRATELQNSARLLAEQMWTGMSTPGAPEVTSTAPPGSAPASSLPVSVDIEDVDADDLLDDTASTAPPRGRFESVPPGVVFRQNAPSDRATPEPFLLSNPQQVNPQPVAYPLHSLPGAWSPAGPAGPSAANAASPPSESYPPSQPPPSQHPPSQQPPSSAASPHAVASAAPGNWGAELPPTTGGTQPGFGPVGPAANGTSGPPVFLTKAPTLQFGSPQQPPADYRKPPPPRRKSIRPKPPPRKSESSRPPLSDRMGGAPPPSSAPHVFSSAPPTDRFSTAPGTRQPLPAARAPLGTAPDLQVSELDLDAASSEGSMLPPPPSEAPLTPEEFERASQRTVIPHSNARASNRPPGFEIDPELADLFAPEEVVEDSDNLDRMSDIVLDPAEFDNQAFVDEGEQTQVLSERGVAALRSAPTGFEVPQSTGTPHSSQRSSSFAGSEHEHQAVSPSIFPTAPPPGHSNGPPQFSRASDPVTRHPTAPSTPFRPAPSSPDLDAPAAPSGDSDRPVRSAPPVLVRRGSAPPSAPVPSASKFTTPPAAKSSRPALTEPVVDGVNLETARGFEDLPPEVQLLLANQARTEELNEGEEVSFFGAAIVTSGTVDILPAFSDESGAVAHSGDVVFTKGHLEESIDLRVAAKLDGTRIAVWEPDTLRAAIAECPWVEDELQLIADRYLAVCGAALGALGERLDDTLRATVFQRLEVRTYTAGEVLAEEDKPIPALFLLGGGRIEICDAQGNVTQTLSMGDFLFSQCLLGGSKAPGTAKAGPGGALVLTASRHVAHELIMSVPPLVEILAG